MGSGSRMARIIATAPKIVIPPAIRTAIHSLRESPVFNPGEPEEVRGGNNIWEVRVDTKTGKPVSKPRRITNWAEGYVMSISGTLNGKQLAVSRYTSQAHVYVGELEAGGRRLKNPRPQTLEESQDIPCDWTPDSKAVLFTSDRNGTRGIYKQGLDQTTAQPVVTGPDYKDWPVVSPDGSWILYLSWAPGSIPAPPRYALCACPPWVDHRSWCWRNEASTAYPAPGLPRLCVSSARRVRTENNSSSRRSTRRKNKGGGN